eukprot:Hpha_TRINITY_DN3127_c0_g1::TRINITY_DN3127_c0_g1_i1::g.96565::m.96565
MGKEVRMDGSEGPFSRDEFVEFYGGDDEWERAPVFRGWGQWSEEEAAHLSYARPRAPLCDPSEGYVDWVTARELQYGDGEDDDTPAPFRGALRVGESKVHGRGVFATRDLQPGEVLLVADSAQLGPPPLRSRAEVLQRKYGVSEWCEQLWPRQVDDIPAELQMEDGDGDRGVDLKLRRLMAVLCCNSHSSGLFPEATAFNHSCRPNCYTLVTPGGRLCIRARAKVGRGEELTICYLGLQGGVAADRVGVLRGRFGFVCKCVECAVPPPVRARAVAAAECASAGVSRPGSADARACAEYAMELEGRRDAARAELTEAASDEAARTLLHCCQAIVEFHAAHARPLDPAVGCAALDAAGAALALGDTDIEKRMLTVSRDVFKAHE